jgi:hypothetical protein
MGSGSDVVPGRRAGLLVRLKGLFRR